MGHTGACTLAIWPSSLMLMRVAPILINAPHKTSPADDPTDEVDTVLTSD